MSGLATPVQAAPSVGAAQRDLARALRAAGVPSPELDARLLVCTACGLSHEDFAARPERPLGEDERAVLARLSARRLRREPVSRILGAREFWGRDFLLGPETLDPRPDTETLIGAGLALLREAARDGARLDILDLGTGTGCILLTLLAELPGMRGVGVDIAPGALEVARANAGRLGLAGRARFVQGSWTSGLEGAFDLVVSNPPYVPSGEMAGLEPEVSQFEPARALDGGADGLQAYRVIAADIARVLRPGGHVLLELGAGQRDAVAGMLGRRGFDAGGMRVWNDLAGRPRCLAMRRIGAGGLEKRVWN